MKLLSRKIDAILLIICLVFAGIYIGLMIPAYLLYGTSRFDAITYSILVFSVVVIGKASKQIISKIK